MGSSGQKSGRSGTEERKGGACIPPLAPSGGSVSAAARGSLLTFGLGLLALLLLAGVHPLTWRRAMPALWHPAAGLGLALIAWFGLPAVALVFLGCLLAGGLAAWQTPQLFPCEGTALGVLVVADSFLLAGELSLAWWLYQYRGRGSRELNDPRSAILYLFLVPCLVLGLFAVLRTGLVVVLCGGWQESRLSAQGVIDLSVSVANFWLGHALGVLIVTPPLLALVTPFLVRRRWAVPEVVDESLVAHRGHPETHGLTRGDWIEILGLALGASILALLLFWIYRRKDLGGWQLWGLPLLLIVWASLRQGVRGGTFVAGTSAALPLLFLLGEPADPQVRLLQGNLLAQCSTALLVAASSTWIKASEMRYRQVVSHSPVLIYSARLLEAPPAEPASPRPEKEEGVGRPSGDRTDAGAPSPAALIEGSAARTTPISPSKLLRRREPTPQAEITLVSSASAGLLGCPPEQLLGEHKHWLERVYADDREVVLAALAQLHRQKQPVTCEYRLVEALSLPLDGMQAGRGPSGEMASRRTPPPPRLRWVRDTLAPHFDDEGRLVGWEGVVTEITEQRYLAEDLRRTTGMFQTLVSNLPTGVFFVQGPLGRPILVNARARQLLGQREDLSVSLEHLCESYRLFRQDGTPYPAEELPVFQALRFGRTTMRDDIVVYRPDGRRIPLVTWGAPVSMGRNNQPDAAVWVLEDLTALHQAEAARRDSEGRLRAVIETMGEGLIVQDRRGLIIESNPTAGHLLGQPPETLRGKSLFALGWLWVQEDTHPLSIDDHPAQLVLRTGRPVRNVVVGIHSGTGAERAMPGSKPGRPTGPGMPRWLLLNAMPLGSPTPSGVVTTFSDITAYRHAQEIVRASEEKYRVLIESLPLMVFQTDAELSIIYSNPAMRSTTLYDESALARPDFWETFIHPDDRIAFQGLLRQALKGQPGRAELRYRAQDGTERIAYVLTSAVIGDRGLGIGGKTTEPSSSSPITNHQSPITVLMVDITRERRLEQDLQRAQRLEMVGRLSSGIAHDFNNLLQVILGLADLVRGSLPAEHQAQNDLEQITEASQQAAQLAGQLLAFSRNRRVVTRRVDVGLVARRTLEMLRPTLPARIDLETQLGDERLCVQADETQLQQVLVNLCLNARDAIQEALAQAPQRERGRILVRIEAENDSFVRLVVEDNGPGMTEQVRARIFDPFFSTKEHGTGLGLAVVQQIVEGCGGRVEVATQPGAGARFEVWLPLLQ